MTVKVPPINAAPPTDVPKVYQPFRGDRAKFEEVARKPITIPPPPKPPWAEAVAPKPRPVVRPLTRKGK